MRALWSEWFGCRLSGRAEAEWLDRVSRSLRVAQEALGNPRLTNDEALARLEVAERALSAEIKRRRRS